MRITNRKTTVPAHAIADFMASVTRRQGGSAPISQQGAERPIFIVGTGRSGTTLLTLMLSLHRRLTIVPESWFVLQLAPRGLFGRWRKTTLEDVLRHPAYDHWGPNRDWMRSQVDSEAAATYPQLVSAVFAAYGAYVGKPRWGDKIPIARNIGPLARLFPDAQFVHIIRDGREVATSIGNQAWGPPNPCTGALLWRIDVQKCRSAGMTLGPDRYFELRYEKLVIDPESVLRSVCAFLSEDYDEQMLEYPKWMSELKPLVPEAHQKLVEPPTAKVRDWRSGMSSREQRAVEAICRPLLVDLGFPSEPINRADLVAASLSVLRALPARWTVLRAAEMLRSRVGL